MNNNEDKNIQSQYLEFLDKLTMEFGEFRLLAESGSTVRYASFKARKQSKILEKLLLDYRKLSIKNDKRTSEIIKNAKKELQENSKTQKDNKSK